MCWIKGAKNLKNPRLSFSGKKLLVQLIVTFIIVFSFQHVLLDHWINDQSISGWINDFLEFSFIILLWAPLFYLVVYRDLKAKRQSDQYLLEHYEKYKVILDNSQLGAFIYDESGFVYVSRVFCKIVGLNENDILGKMLHENTLFDPETTVIIENYTKKRLAHQDAPEQYTVTTRQKDGSKLDLEFRVKTSILNGKPIILGSISDVTEKNKLETSLKDSEKLYRRLFESNMDLVIIANHNGVIIDVNQATEEAMGYKRTELIGQHYSILVYPEDLPKVEDAFERVMQGESTRYQTKGIDKHGEIRIFTVSVMPLYFEEEITGFFAFVKDITEQEHYLETIQKLAFHDFLTGLPNRHYFTQECQSIIDEAKEKDRRLALFYLDLDRVKVVNDNLGHAAGDELLKEASARFKKVIQNRGFISRIGGDEFAIIVPYFQSIDQVTDLAQNLLSILTEPIHLEHHNIQSKTSLGISLFPEHGDNLKTLMQAADTAMFQAKRLGGNQFKFYEKYFDPKNEKLFDLENDFAKAIHNREFFLAYQPKVDSETHEIRGVEALVRWKHPLRGIISPGEFIPIAEKTGLIVPLGEWVLREACLQAIQLQSNGFLPFRMAVNASVLQFQRTNFPVKVNEILEETGLEAKWLEIEITEGTFMEENQVVVEGISKLKEMGVYISLDDFGSGYSSMKYLHEFRIHALKIDRAFIEKVDQHKERAAIVQSIIQLAHGLSMQVVAEGVETHEELDFVRNLGVDEIQGYFISKPISAAEIEQFLVSMNETRERG